MLSYANEENHLLLSFQVKLKILKEGEESRESLKPQENMKVS